MKTIKILFIFVIYFLEMSGMHASTSLEGSVRAKLKDLILVSNISPEKKKRIDSEMLSINGVTFKPDSTAFVAAYYALTGPSLKIWSPENKNAFVNYQDKEILSFQCIAFSNDGKSLLAGSDQRLCLWDTTSMKITRQIFLDHINAYSLAFSKSGKKIIVGSAVGVNNLAILTLTEKQGTGIRLLSGHKKGTISSVGFSPDSTRAVSVSGSKCKVWDTTQGDMLYKICGNSWSDCKVEYDKDNGWFLTGYEENDGVLGNWFLYNLNTQKIIRINLLGIILPHVKAYERSACGDYIFLGNAENGNVTVFNLRTKKHIYTIEGMGCSVSKIAASPDGKYLTIAIKEKCASSLWLYNLMSEEDQKVLAIINSIDLGGLQFLQDVLPRTESTMKVPEKILDNDDFKSLPRPLRTLFHKFIDRKNSSFDKSYIIIDPKKSAASDDDWALID